MEIGMPTSLYGMAIVEPAMLDRRLDGNFMVFFEMARIYGMLFINYCVVSIFIAQLWKMGRESQVADCNGHMLMLEIGCVFLFEVRMLADVRRGLAILNLLWWLDSPKKDDTPPTNSMTRMVYQSVKRSNMPQQPQHGAVMVKEDTQEERSFFTQMTSRMSRRSGKAAKHWKLHDVSWSYRILCAVTVALPKLTLDLMLAYFGGVYVVRSADDSEMVLNTLAVVFIAEIDELLYVAFTSDAMRYSLEAMPGVEIELTNRQRVIAWFIWSILSPLFTFLTSGLVVHRTRAQDCPDFSVSWEYLGREASSFFSALTA